MKTTSNRIAFFDIETEGNDEALMYLPDPSPPSNYKDEAKIKAWVEEKKLEKAEKAALNIDYGKIIGVGVRLYPTGKTRGWIVGERYSEKQILNYLWAFIAKAGGVVCGYNVLGFDIPFIIRRSFALELQPPVYLSLRRYSNYPVLDLMQVLAGWDNQRYIGLKQVCKLYGIENPLPDLDGSQIADMDDETRLVYVKNDVDLTVGLYERMRGYYPLR